MRLGKVLTTGVTGAALAVGMIASALPANAASGYHAAYFSESDFLAKTAGQTGQFAVGYLNTGDQAWVKGASGQQADLGTAAPLENSNEYVAGWSNGWLSPNRYTAQNAAFVAPGQIGFFIYNFSVPAGAAIGEHRFYGREVIEGVTYMEDYGYYQSVTVTAPAGPLTTTSLSPNSGPSAGGNAVVITGTGFVCTPTVSFGTATAPVTSCSATSITATAPAGAAGAVQVSVTNAGGVASNSQTYTYADTVPLSQDIRIATNAGFTGLLDARDVFTVAFNEAMQPVANGSKIRLVDTDGTVADVICGSSASSPAGSSATCVKSATDLVIGVVTFPAGQVVTVTLYADPATITPGSNPGLGLPSSVIDAAGFIDLAGNPWNIAGSPDKTLN